MGVFVITGGGTGGHLAVARSIKEAFIAQGDDVVFIGSTNGQDRAWFENEWGWKRCYFLPTRGVVNQSFFGKIISLGKIVIATLHCAYILKKHKAEGVISVGGYSASPAAFGSFLAGIPLFIHEQNGVTGRLNGLLKPFAKGFFSSFDTASPCKDYPVREEFFAHQRLRNKVNTIIFLGGSQGAKAINDFALKLAPLLAKKGIAIIHQTGKNEIDHVTEAYHILGIEADVFAFDNAIVKRYEKADFAVSRAGASALFELAANGLPTLFVPYPFAAGDHQMANAMFLVDQKCAFVSRENDLSVEMVMEKIESDMSEVSQKLMDSIAPHGAIKIVQEIKKVVEQR
jgi:UDP-N-acetylglucosamine--N-acetylmuramyl-(pentapeptide) pyrophosphoryl-undecaprenol N-acetylglucosamine transferase